jgi:hypothetical protein
VDGGIYLDGARGHYGDVVDDLQDGGLEGDYDGVNGGIYLGGARALTTTSWATSKAAG